MPATSSRIKLYIAEEQELLRETYKSFFLSQPEFEVVEFRGDMTVDSLLREEVSQKPEVMLLGFKTLQPSTVKVLERIRESYAQAGIVLLFAHYNIRGIQALRHFFRGSTPGYAYLMKHTIDTMEQLAQVIHSVAEGRVIVDPIVMDGLMVTAEPSFVFLQELIPLEMQVLNWMAKGYRNETIARALGLEHHVVEQHIKSIYSKLGNHSRAKNPRLLATVLYLKATGQLAAGDYGQGFTEDLTEESGEDLAEDRGEDL